MLTQSEKAWLERREEMPGYYCRWCPLWDNEADCDGRSPHPFCPIFRRRERLWDAAEFSERVAAKLAIAYAFGDNPPDDDNPLLTCKDCPANACCKLSDGCDEGILKWARLAVEEEMDAER